jgi:hypothetical protein
MASINDLATSSILKKMKKPFFLLLFLLFIVARCSDERDIPGQSDTQLAFSSRIIEAESMPAEAITQWQEGDQIGVFAEGDVTHHNIPYSTSGGGYFSSTNPIYYPTGSGSFNRGAERQHTPHRPHLKSTEHPLQQQPERSGSRQQRDAEQTGL